ncbi:guanine-N(7)-methyltransferase [Cladochytrium replicatum]|nr:guanine-N(7)-methyltransferase [Cladochytrium replicatum]
MVFGSSLFPLLLPECEVFDATRTMDSTNLLKRQNEHPDDSDQPNKLNSADRARKVAEHYNAREDVGRVKRKQSPIFHLKAFNNWIKSALIGRYTKPGNLVLDMCCGKGGDLLKFQSQRISHLVGVDIAEQSIEHARERYSSGRFQFSAEYHAADCFVVDLMELFPENRNQFDVANVQFAFHYSFETEAKARRGLQNITESLKPGGVFIGTIPNAYQLVRKLRRAPELSFGNDVYKVTFTQKDMYPAFGHEYVFDLVDAIDHCPEYLVHFPTFRRLAEETGLELIYKKTLHEMFTEEVQNEESLRLLYRMGAVDELGKLPADQWEAIGIYMAFAFRKK